MQECAGQSSAQGHLTAWPCSKAPSTHPLPASHSAWCWLVRGDQDSSVMSALGAVYTTHHPALPSWGKAKSALARSPYNTGRQPLARDYLWELRERKPHFLPHVFCFHWVIGCANGTFNGKIQVADMHAECKCKELVIAHVTSTKLCQSEICSWDFQSSTAEPWITETKSLPFQMHRQLISRLFPLLLLQSKEPRTPPVVNKILTKL